MKKHSAILVISLLIIATLLLTSCDINKYDRRFHYLDIAYTEPVLTGYMIWVCSKPVGGIVMPWTQSRTCQ